MKAKIYETNKSYPKRLVMEIDIPERLTMKEVNELVFSVVTSFQSWTPDGLSVKDDLVVEMDGYTQTFYRLAL